MHNKIGILGALMAAASAAPRAGSEVVTIKETAPVLNIETIGPRAPQGSVMFGQFCRRSQRKLRRDARRLGTTVAKLKK